MMDDRRTITVELPEALVSRLEEVAEGMGRSLSGIVGEAASQWLAEERRRYELTLEALNSIDEGRTISHEEMLAMVEQRKRERRGA